MIMHIILTEGNKKAIASLSIGLPTVSIPGGFSHLSTKPINTQIVLTTLLSDKS